MKTALVSGVGRGLGHALLPALFESGWAVIGIVRNEQDALRLTGALGSRAQILQADLTSLDFERVLASALEKLGLVALDCLINNAGLSLQAAPLRELGVESLRRLLDVNLVGAVRLTRACLPYLERGNAPLVVNISSRLGSLSRTIQPDGIACSYAYRMSKASLNMFTACMATDASLVQVKVVSLHPGAMRTGMNSNASADDPKTAAARIVRLIDSADRLKSGAFIDENGLPIPW